MATENTGTTVAIAPTAAPAAEPSMAEYAAAREAEIRGKAKPALAAPAVAPEPKEPAAATEEEVPAAAATGEKEEEGEPTAATATDGEPDAEIEEAHPAKKGIQKRFSEMTAKQKELQAQADTAKAATDAANQRAADAEARANRLQEEAEVAQAAVPHVVEEADDPKPNPAEFEDPDAYVAAISAHATRQELRRANQAAKDLASERAEAANKEAQAAQLERNNAAIAELHSNFNKRVTEVKPDYPDYDEKVKNNTELVLRNDVFFTIEKAVDSPHLLYHIASNPDVAAELNKLHPQDAAIRIGEIQAELRIARKPKVTKAAAPINPVGNRESPMKKSPNEESMEEYADRVQKEMDASAHKRTRII